MSYSLLIAQTAPTGGESSMMMFMPMILLFAIFYIMVIRPQQRKEKERKKMISEAQKGQRVIFGGGMFGTIANVKEGQFTVKIADNVKVEILKGAVTQILEKGDQPEDEVAGSK